MSRANLSDEQFYLVWSPEGTYPPSVTYRLQRDATSESERLARQNPGKRFYVLRGVAVAEVPVPTITRELVEPDDTSVPF